MTLDAVQNPDADGVVGSIVMYAGEILPSAKWRWAHGAQEISRTEFSLYYSRVGDRWGNGDGSTTVDLPNLDKLMPVGWDSTGGDTDFDTVGGTGGTKSPGVAAHSHTISPDPHTHTGGVDVAIGGTPGVTYGVSSSISTSPTGGTSLTVNANTASGTNMPPFATVRFIVKVA